MTRPRKQTVDYFPHDCNHGQTMFMLEQRFGNDGYAFWFKLLELLGKTEGHFLDCQKMSTWAFICTRARVDDRVACEIMELLADLEAIDTDLWRQRKIVWSDNFVNGLSFAYRNRAIEIPSKPDILRKESGICRDMPVNQRQKSANEMKWNEMKDKEREGVEASPSPPPVINKSKKQPTTPLPSDFKISDRVRDWAKRKGYDRLDEHLDAFLNIVRSKGHRYVSWDDSFMNCIRQDWGKIRSNGGTRASPPEPEPTYKCLKCRDTGIRKANNGEDQVDGRRVCECHDPNWVPRHKLKEKTA